MYLYIVIKATCTALNIKGEEVEHHNEACGLIDDPLTHLVVRIRVRVKGCTNLA